MSGDAVVTQNGSERGEGLLSPASIAAGPLDELVRRQKDGLAAGLTSVCSAHPLVLEAAALHARDADRPLLVEATSNQVDQDGGYTGMRPADFRDLVHGIAADAGLPRERVILGGDHLGPNRWRELSPADAMGRAEDLIAAYTRAGFTKLHVDCTFPCAGDPDPLGDRTVAERAARLIAAAERAAGPHASRLRYVIGTEVPTPGGEREGSRSVTPTTPAAARETLACHRRALAEHGAAGCWHRVLALVVQPGVDFAQMEVLDYERPRTAELRHVLDEEPAMVFEAHSTDYQTASALKALVEDHWAILKVGPALTFALREALFALEAIERELVGAPRRSRLPEVIEERMLADPVHWRGYDAGTSAAERLGRRYGYSDRVRYYWPDPEVADAQNRLLANLQGIAIPLPLLSALMPVQYDRVRAGELESGARALVLDRVRDVLRDYDAACAEAEPGAVR
jgi:D-tagatose-1,6-bisphosphate aldolase subunit GatZ/KbaZ